jgi:excisionase family DNA binding protein
MRSEAAGEFKLLSLRRVSKELGLGFNTTKKLVIEGRLEAVKIGRRYKVAKMKVIKFIEDSKAIDIRDNESSIESEADETELKNEFAKLRKERNGNYV